MGVWAEKSPVRSSAVVMEADMAADMVGQLT